MCPPGSNPAHHIRQDSPAVPCVVPFARPATLIKADAARLSIRLVVTFLHVQAPAVCGDSGEILAQELKVGVVTMPEVQDSGIQTSYQTVLRNLCAS